jgi:hypothetical protein
MCRSIHTLNNLDPSATEAEIHAAALQYVRKISGFSKPSKANQAAFQNAVEEITAVSTRLLTRLKTSASLSEGRLGNNLLREKLS